MRRNTHDQTKASRENGSKSKGPVTKFGKSKSAQNPTKDGIFSQGVVIESLGEKRQEFENVKKLFWNVFQPSNMVEEMFVSDLVENWWRRERVRRAEAVEVQQRLELTRLEHDLKRSDEGETLRSRFAILFREYAISVRVAPTQNIPKELQDVRQQLASTVLGIDFLVMLLNMIGGSLQKTGELSQRERALLDVISGFGDTGSAAAKVLDPAGEIFRRRRERAWASEHQTEASDTEANEGNQPEARVHRHETVALMENFRIETSVDNFEERKRKLQVIEEVGFQNRVATSMVDPVASDRFSRAETQAERRMYRALSGLAAARSQNSPNLLPPANPKLQNKT